MRQNEYLWSKGLKKTVLENTVGKREDASNNVFNPFQNNFHFSVTFILSSANAFNLDQSKILSLSKEFN